MRVLIVDDNELGARSLKRALERRHEVRLAQSADEALAALAQKPADAIVCDFELGAHTSASLLRTVTRLHPTVRRVLYSALLPERWIELVEHKLIDIALGKPISLDQLFAAIERA